MLLAETPGNLGPTRLSRFSGGSSTPNWHVAKRGDRWAALEPIRQGVQQTHGGYAPKIALGLGLRMDWGPSKRRISFSRAVVAGHGAVADRVLWAGTLEVIQPCGTEAGPTESLEWISGSLGHVR